MGLIETQSVGLPAIGLKGCSGVNELILDNENGFLTDENPKLFARKIEELICDKNLRINLGRNAVNNSKIYNKADIDNCWLEVVECVLKGDPPLSFINYPENNKQYKLFPLSKIYIKCGIKPVKFYQQIFSVSNSFNKKHKIIRIFGIKIKIKRKTKKCR